MATQFKLSSTEENNYGMTSRRGMGNNITVVGYQTTTFTKDGADLSMVGLGEDRG
jgi:hypothetical protein